MQPTCGPDVEPTCGLDDDPISKVALGQCGFPTSDPRSKRRPTTLSLRGPNVSMLSGYGHVIRDRALVELSVRKFSFRAREGLLGYRVNVLFVLPQPGLEFSVRLSNIGRVSVATLNLIYTISCLKLIEFVLGAYQYVTQCLVGFHGHRNVVFLEDSFETF